MKKYLWKVWLRSNRQTPGQTNFVADVDAAGSTRCQQDIIDRIVEKGSDVKPDIIKTILDRANAAKKQFVLEGYDVYDGFVHFTPRIIGHWMAKEAFTRDKHRLTVDTVLAKSVHEALQDVDVDVMGVADSGARIMLVTDVASEKTDGTVTMGDNIIITGDKIKVMGIEQSDGSMESGIGVFFVDESGYTWGACRISENQPSRLLVRAPYVMGGCEGLTLRVVTRFDGSGLLKTPRVIEYALPVTLTYSSGPLKGQIIEPVMPGEADAPQQ
ncbi:MAG: DUF4469 domain-containing protein [Tannerellaceae bacterium]|jgi:hypothetical protein|nr:DUF4469 domain-containing protein [Tannerellaceae bacterium]